MTLSCSCVPGDFFFEHLFLCEHFVQEERESAGKRGRAGESERETHTHIQTRTYTHTHTHTYHTRAHTQSQTKTHTQLHTHTVTQTHTRTYTHTQTHTHKHDAESHRRWLEEECSSALDSFGPGARPRTFEGSCTAPPQNSTRPERT